MDMESSKRKQTGAEERRRTGQGRFPLLLFLAALLVLSLLLLCAAKRGVTLRVAVYPYVPDRIRFQQAVEAQWAARHLEVQLDFVPWDGYAEDPPEDLDVFVYDAVFFYDFLEKGYLLPIPDGEIRDIEDFIPCALAACRVDGTAYALPQLLCTNLLYTRKGDAELSGVKNLSELYRIIGDSPQASGPSSVGEGLLLSIPDELSAAL
jgi:thiamine pyridinylase